MRVAHFEAAVAAVHEGFCGARFVQLAEFAAGAEAGAETGVGREGGGEHEAVVS